MILGYDNEESFGNEQLIIQSPSDIKREDRTDQNLHLLNDLLFLKSHSTAIVKTSKKYKNDFCYSLISVNDKLAFSSLYNNLFNINKDKDNLYDIDEDNLYDINEEKRSKFKVSELDESDILKIIFTYLPKDTEIKVRRIIEHNIDSFISSFFLFDNVTCFFDDGEDFAQIRAYKDYNSVVENNILSLSDTSEDSRGEIVFPIELLNMPDYLISIYVNYLSLEYTKFYEEKRVYPTIHEKYKMLTKKPGINMNIEYI